MLFILLVSLAAVNSQECGVDFSFASYYANNMVLQRSPTEAAVWGYAFAVGDQVTVNIQVGDIVRSYTTFAEDGSAGRPIWKVSMNPVDEGGPYEISAASEGCRIELSNIMFGDVWLCSGQSNMVHLMNNIDDPEDELADVVNYPDVRVFRNALEYTDTPQEDLVNIAMNWAIPTEENIGTYSAVCWLYGRNLYRKYQRPIGLVQTAWGGTRIEAWSSPAALEVCFPDGAPGGTDQNEASALYNAMIHPFQPMPIYGALWYQGESNTNNYADYGCAQQQMVEDWRASWFANSPSMDPQFPFGLVQLAPSGTTDTDRGFPGVRWSQSYEYGYTPNDLLQRFFMAVVMDTPDFGGPHGEIHPRWKRQVADRLYLAGLAVAYGDESEGLWQAPLPTAFSIQDPNLVITLGDGSVELEARDTDTSTHYEVCCSTDPAQVCVGEGDGTTTRWELTAFVSVANGQVTVSMPCDLTQQFAVGVRYAWRQSPCVILEACCIHTVENGLPVPPFVYDGLIE